MNWRALLLLLITGCGNVHKGPLADNRTSSVIAPLNRTQTVRLLPSDSSCRIRYVAKEGYRVYRGQSETHEKPFFTYTDAQAFAQSLEKAGTCTVVLENCAVDFSNQGYWVLLEHAPFEGAPSFDLSVIKSTLTDLAKAGICSNSIALSCPIFFQTGKAPEYWVQRADDQGRAQFFHPKGFSTADEATTLYNSLKSQGFCL